MRTDAQKQVDKNVSKLKEKEAKSMAKAAEVKSAGNPCNSGDLKAAVAEIMQLKKKAADANGDIRSAFSKWEKKGVDKAALKDVIKITSASTNNDDHKATVNIYMEMLGHLPLFHFADSQATKH